MGNAYVVISNGQKKKTQLFNNMIKNYIKSVF